MLMKMMLDMVVTMFMMVDEDGGYNDGGQPNFLPEKVKDSEARPAPPSSYPRKYYCDGGGDVEKGRQKILKKGRQKGCIKNPKIPIDLALFDISI